MYFTLAVREAGTWAPQFGDFDRSVVRDEGADYRDHGHRARDLRVIATQSSQAAVMAAIAALNAA